MAFTAKILSWRFRHPNIVGCLIKRRPTKGGHGHPRTPPPLATPLLLLNSLLWSWSFSGLRNVPCDAFSLKWLQISLGWFSKNRLDIPSQVPSQSHLRNGQPSLSSLTCIFFFFFYFKVPRLKGPCNFLISKSRNAHQPLHVLRLMIKIHPGSFQWFFHVHKIVCVKVIFCCVEPVSVISFWQFVRL